LQRISLSKVKKADKSRLLSVFAIENSTENYRAESYSVSAGRYSALTEYGFVAAGFHLFSAE